MNKDELDGKADALRGRVKQVLMIQVPMTDSATKVQRTKQPVRSNRDGSLFNG